MIKIEIKDNLSDEDSLKVAQYAFVDCGCEGTHDYSVEEEEIDRVLGDDAFCGGELEEKYYELIEEKMEKESSRFFFWSKGLEGHVDKFKKYLGENNIGYDVSEVEIEDWNQNWRKNFKRILVSEGLSVIPSWEKEKNNNNDVYIYPGMGFGTGNHETTFLCLKMYEEIEPELASQHQCLDFGCGSGILGLAPMKRKNAHVDFVDIDEEALDNCVINLEINEHALYKGEKSVVLRERFKANRKYQLVFANILENVLEDEYTTLKEVGEKGGFLIVSGLLNHQVENIVHKYHSLKMVKTLSQGDWSAVLFQY